MTDQVSQTAAALTSDTPPTAAPDTGAQLTSAPAAPATPSISWLADADETTAGYVANKGWQTPADLLNSYRNLEKAFGGRADSTVTLPGQEAKPEEWNAVYDKLGRPADASGYNIPVPEGFGDKEFSEKAGGWFHELGLSQKQGEALAAKWNEYVGGTVATQQAQAAQQFESENSALRQQWGSAFDQNVNAARAATQSLGLDAQSIDKIAGSLGHKATMELFARIGGKSLEGDFVGSSSASRFGNALSPGEAKAKLDSLKSDKAFVARYVAKDAEATNEMARLMKYAFPEGQ